MKYYRLIDPYTGDMTIEDEIEMRKNYYSDLALKQRLLKEQDNYFKTGDPDYAHISADKFTFADYIEQLENDGLLKGVY